MQPQINQSLVTSINNLQISIQIIFFLVVMNTDLSKQQPLTLQKMHRIKKVRQLWLVN